MKTSFVYVPRPAQFGKAHPDQRYFFVGPMHVKERCVYSSLSQSGTYMQVMRFAPADHAQVGMSIRGHGVILIGMTAQELRNLAQQCLDAAQDLDDFPAATLAAPNGGE